MEPRKWSIFVIVRAYSIGTFSTLKVGLVPMETTDRPPLRADLSCETRDLHLLFKCKVLLRQLEIFLEYLFVNAVFAV